MTTVATKWIKISLGAMISLVIIPSPAHANTGIPMLAILWSFSWFFIIPVILIEYWIVKKIPKAKPKTGVMGAVTFANLCSTFVGIPITWGIFLVVLKFFGLGGGFFSASSKFWNQLINISFGGPDIHFSEMHWFIPVFWTILFILIYPMSSWIEGIIVARFLQNAHQPREIKKAVWIANSASYAFLYILAVYWLI